MTATLLSTEHHDREGVGLVKVYLLEPESPTKVADPVFEFVEVSDKAVAVQPTSR